MYWVNVQLDHQLTGQLQNDGVLMMCPHYPMNSMCQTFLSSLANSCVNNSMISTFMKHLTIAVQDSPAMSMSSTMQLQHSMHQVIQVTTASCDRKLSKQHLCGSRECHATIVSS